MKLKPVFAGCALPIVAWFVAALPAGDVALSSLDHGILRDSIKVNQFGYGARSSVRYANLGIFLGDLGTRKLPAPPAYEVVKFPTGGVVFTGRPPTGATIPR